PVAGGATTSGWGDAGRAAAEQEVSAARTPRFAPLRVDAGEAGLARRGPGAGPPPRARPRRGGGGPPPPAVPALAPPPPAGPPPARGRGAARGPPPEGRRGRGGGGGPPPGPLPAAADQAAKPYEPFGTGPYPVVGAAASSLESPSVFSAPAVASDAYVDDGA